MSDAGRLNQKMHKRTWIYEGAIDTGPFARRGGHRHERKFSWNFFLKMRGSDEHDPRHPQRSASLRSAFEFHSGVRVLCSGTYLRLLSHFSLLPCFSPHHIWKVLGCVCAHHFIDTRGVWLCERRCRLCFRSRECECAGVCAYLRLVRRGYI